MPPASNKPHSAGKYSGLASNLAHLDRIRLSPGQGAAARWQMMLPAESGTLPHRPWTPMSLVNGRSPQAKRCGRDEAKRKSVRKRLPLRGSRCGTSGSSSTAQSKVPSGGATCRTSSIGTSNLLNQLHREADVLANNGAKWAGAEGVRGSNLACFLKNFVSNYIVIFLMMLFRVHL